jgi:hypothetical protein
VVIGVAMLSGGSSGPSVVTTAPRATCGLGICSQGRGGCQGAIHVGLWRLETEELTMAVLPRSQWPVLGVDNKH